MKSVVLCGSRRFTKEIREFGSALKKAGVVVYEPFLRSGSEGDWDSLSEADKGYVALGLTHDHFYKIRRADVVFVYNKGGYSGVSTTMEIAYSVACGKPIYALENDDEWCRKVLFKDFIKTPNELIKLLK